MKALVTGGGGFLGSRIVKMLHERGDEVVALGRRRYPQLEQCGIRTVQADLSDPDSISAACKDKDIVFHAGALTAIWGKRKAFWQINVEGTRNVINACRQNGVGRLVYTSTPSVVFGEDELCDVDETQPYPKHFLAPYPETKAIAEQLVLAANKGALATIALRPHLVWGPGDPHLIPRVIERARRGRLVQVGDGRNLVDITYIDNAAEAHLLAADALNPTSNCSGKAYFISQGEPVPLWPWLNDIIERVGVPKVNRTMSYAAARRIGAVLEFVYGLIGVRREPRMTRFLASQLAKSHYFDISAARRDLGYVPRISTSEGIQRLLSSLQR